MRGTARRLMRHRRPQLPVKALACSSPGRTISSYVSEVRARALRMFIDFHASVALTGSPVQLSLLEARRCSSGAKAGSHASSLPLQRHLYSQRPHRGHRRLQ